MSLKGFPKGVAAAVWAGFLGWLLPVSALAVELTVDAGSNRGAVQLKSGMNGGIADPDMPDNLAGDLKVPFHYGSFLLPDDYGRLAARQPAIQVCEDLVSAYAVHVGAPVFRGAMETSHGGDPGWTNLTEIERAMRLAVRWLGDPGDEIAWEYFNPMPQPKREHVKFAVDEATRAVVARRPWNDLPAWNAFVTSYAQQALAQKPRVRCFEVLDSPDYWINGPLPGERSPTAGEYLQVYTAAYDRAKAVSTEFKVGGPDLGTYDGTVLRNFLNAVVNKVDYLSWSEGDLSAIASHVSDARSARNLPIHINRVIGEDRYRAPATALASLAHLETSGVAFAARNAVLPAGSTLGRYFLGLLHYSPAGLSQRPVWWAYKSYGDAASDIRLSTTTSDTSVLPLASRNGATLRILFGNYNTQTPAPLPVTLAVQNIQGFNIAQVALSRLPNSDLSMTALSPVEKKLRIQTNSFSLDLRPFMGDNLDLDPDTAVSGVVTLVQDITPPTVAIAQPLAGPVRGSAVPVSGSAADNIEVAEVKVFLDTGPSPIRTFTPGAPTWSFNWDTMGLSEGAHTLRAKSYDLAGNVSAEVSVTVTVDNLHAQITNTTVPPSIEAGRSAQVTLTVRNTGTKTWYGQPVACGFNPTLTCVALRPVPGRPSWGIDTVALPVDALAPDGAAPFTFSITAPQTTGIHAFQWEMCKINPFNGQCVEAMDDPSLSVNIDVTPNGPIITQVTPPRVSICRTVNCVTITFNGFNFENNPFNNCQGLGVKWEQRGANPPHNGCEPLTHVGTTQVRYVGSAWTPDGIYDVRIQNSPTEISASAEVVVEALPNDAEYLSGTPPPAVVDAGQAFTAAATFKNVGANTWSPPDYFLRNIGSDWQRPQIELDAPVSKGGSKTFQIQATAPTLPGNYTFRWQMVQLVNGNHVLFGDPTPLVTIRVRDGTAPQIAITAPTAGARLSYIFMVEGTASDDTLVTRVELEAVRRRDGQVFSLATLPTPPVPPQRWTYLWDTRGLQEDGDYTLRAKAFDNSIPPNETTASVDVALFNPDPHAGFVRQKIVLDGQDRDIPPTLGTNTSYTVKIQMKNIGDSEWTGWGHLGHMLGSLNGGIWGVRGVPGLDQDRVPMCPGGICTTAVGNSFEFVFDIRTPSVPGPYPFQWQMLYRDWGGGETPFEDKTPPLTLTLLDETGPTVHIQVPAPDQEVSEMATISGTASDDSLVVSSVAFYVNGEWKGAIRDPQQTQNWSFSWNTRPPLPNGNYTLTVKAWDPLGHLGEASVRVKVANRPIFDQVLISTGNPLRLAHHLVNGVPGKLEIRGFNFENLLKLVYRADGVPEGELTLTVIDERNAEISGIPMAPPVDYEVWLRNPNIQNPQQRDSQDHRTVPVQDEVHGTSPGSIGPQGGEVHAQVSAMTVSVQVAPGTLDEPLNFNVVSASETAPQRDYQTSRGLTPAGPSVDITAHRTGGPAPKSLFASSVDEFSKPIQIQLPFYPDNGLLISAASGTESYGMFYWDEGRQVWQAIPGAVVDEKSRTVKVSVDHLTVFQVFKVRSHAARGKFGEVFAYPNPAGDRVTIHVEAGQAKRVEIRLYDLAGTLLHRAELPGPAGIGINGKAAFELPIDTSRLSSGAYFYSVRATWEDGSAQVARKLAVLR